MRPTDLQVHERDEIERYLAEHEDLIVDSAWTGGLVIGGLVVALIGQVWVGVPALVAGALHGWHTWQEAREP